MRKITKNICLSLVVYAVIAILYYSFLTFWVYSYQTMNLKESFSKFWDINKLNGSDVTLFSITLKTLLIFLINFIASSLLGILIGVVLGKNRLIGNISDYFINFFRVMPSIIFIVLFKYQFKFYDSYVFLVGIIASIWPIIINTKSGVEKANFAQRESIKILNLPFEKEIFSYTLPKAFPNIWDGMKISIGISFLITITCEYLDSSLKGLGSLLKDLDTDNEYPLAIMCVILWIGLIGIIINLIFDFLETKILWLKRHFSTNNEYDE